jgi:hypothetical protein
MVKRASTASFNQITVCMLAGNQTTGVKPHVQQLPTAGSGGAINNS